MFNKKRILYSILYFIIAIFHLFLSFIFKPYSTFFTYYNIIAIIIYILLGILILKIKNMKYCGLMCYLEIIIYSILGSILIGNTLGFNLYLICIIPLSFYLPYIYYNNFHIPFIYIFLEIIIYFITLFIGNNDTIIPENIQFLINFINSFISILLLVGFFIVFLKHIKEREQELKISATIDELTGLLNRKLFNNYFDNYKSYNNLTLAICDIDDFKKINDKYGHDFGDIVLKTVSGIFKNYQNNIKHFKVFRWGGEEFLILLKNDTPFDILNNLKKDIQNCTIYNKNTNEYVKFTISIGFSNYKPNISKSMLLKIADKALYESKNTGKNKITYKVNKEE